MASSSPSADLSAEELNYWYLIFSRPYSRNKRIAFQREFLSGVTVALAQVPEAVAFSFTAGVPPIIGLQAAWIICLLTGLLGGAPGMISGATGALAVVLPAFVSQFGLGYLFYAVIMMGVIQLVLGLIGAGKVVRLIGTPVMVGFCNGLAIVIGLAQFHSFKTTDHGVNGTKGEEHWVDAETLGWQLFLVAITMLVIWLLPKLTKLIPSSLAGIILATILEFALIRPVGFSTPVVEDLASVQGFFPIPIWLDENYKDILPSLGEAQTWAECIPIAFTLAVIGLVESLMTLQLVSEITQKPGNPKRECLAQGFSNVVIGMFGGMGGCAMIGQSMINVKSGGITRISSSTAGLFLLFILLVAYPLINLIPVASLAGVMFMVVIGTFEWHSFRILFAALMPLSLRSHPRVNFQTKVKHTDVLIILVVTVVAVVVNLAWAVLAGVALSALIFAWDQGSDFEVTEEQVKVQDEAGLPVKVYKLHGALFFGSAQKFDKYFSVDSDPQHVELHFERGSIGDYSALAAINSVAHRYKRAGKVLKLRRLQDKSMKAIRKAHHMMFSYDHRLSPEEIEEELNSMQEDIPVWYDDAAHMRGHNETDGEEPKKETDSASSTEADPFKTENGDGSVVQT